MILNGWSKKITCFFTCAAIIFGSMSGCRGAENRSNASRTGAVPAALIFEDNFDGSEIDAEKWERCPEMTRCEGMDVWDDSLSYLNGNGQLIIGARWNREERRVHSGAIQTKDNFSGGYGYYEASVRFPKAYGIWGAFWLMVGDVENESSGSVDGIEIDIVESIGNENGVWDHALHWDGYKDNTKKDGVYLSDLKIYDGKFHTFALWRTETDYIFYVDGKETWRSRGGGICPLGSVMLLSVEAAAWAGGGTEEGIKSLPAQMEVDYVRVWDANPYLSGSAGGASEKKPEENAGEELSLTLQIDNPVMTVNGEEKTIDQQGTAPVLVNGRTLLPVRAIVEEFGGDVSWEDETQTVVLSRGKDLVKLQINSRSAYLNGKEYTLDVAPIVLGGRTMLPVRFIAEGFHLNVTWEPENSEIIIEGTVPQNTSKI